MRVVANRYKIQGELGRGGMGTVYRGLDTVTGQAVAVKQLKPEIASPELIERFRREGQSLRELNHPNIVKMLEAVQENGENYLVLEYVSGGDLRLLLAPDGGTAQATPLPITKVLNIAIDLADALTRAHRLDIIHRDLKPANVLIAEDGTVRLTDFGVAYAINQDRITDTDAVIGTVDYLSPEALQGEQIDHRADIWAFGVVLFEMLAGERPFNGNSPANLMMNIVTKPLPDLEQLRPGAPVALVDLVYRMLEKDRNARIASVRHVGAELEDIQHGRVSSPLSTRFAEPPADTITFLPKHNLPSQTTHFVGREAEISELSGLLEDPALRLVTIVAQGGMGKTRLAVEVAARYAAAVEGPNLSKVHRIFEHGVYFVELAPLSNPDNLASAIAEALGYHIQADGRSDQQQIVDFLATKDLLLVLDNFEHLLEGATLVTVILKAAPKVKILTTSRQHLNQSGETRFNLTGMNFPEWETPDDALEYAAVKLFVQSAKRVRPQFELTVDNMDSVARICILVQGMPLGILLAASWLGMLSVEEIAAEIAKGIDFLEAEMSDLPERHRSIRSLFDSSWDMMDDLDRDVFMKLTVFRGGFTREAAQAVANASLRVLMNLMNKSLIRRNNATGRYEIHELLRQYGEHHLSENKADANTQKKHAEYYVSFSEQAGLGQLNGLEDRWYAWLEADHDNLRTALKWAHDADDSRIIFLRLVVALTNFWAYVGYVAEGQKWVKHALALSEQVDPLLRGKTLNSAGRLLGYSGQNRDLVKALHKEALEIFREHDDKRNAAIALVRLSLASIGYPAEYNTAIGYCEEAMRIFRQIDDQFGIADAYIVMGELARSYGDLDNALKFYEESLPRFRELGTIRHEINNLINVGFVAQNKGEYQRAETYFRSAVFLAYKHNIKLHQALTVACLAGILVVTGRAVQAAELLGLSDAFFETIGFTWQVGDQVEIDRARTAARTLLGEEEYNLAYERGTSLDLQIVVRGLLDDSQ